MSRNNGIRYSEYRLRQARTLRAQGMSVKRIAKRLHISPSTASLWVRGVVLTDEQRERLRLNNTANRGAFGHRLAVKAAESRARWRQEARTLWERWRHDPLFLLGIGLYCGEGTKAYPRLSVANADEAVIRIWVRWCAKFIPSGELKVEVSYPQSADGEPARRHWAKVTGITTVSAYRNRKTAEPAKRRTRLLPFGTASVKLRRGSAEWWTKMMEWIRLSEELC